MCVLQQMLMDSFPSTPKVCSLFYFKRQKGAETAAAEKSATGQRSNGLSLLQPWQRRRAIHTCFFFFFTGAGRRQSRSSIHSAIRDVETAACKHVVFRFPSQWEASAAPLYKYSTGCQRRVCPTTTFVSVWSVKKNKNPKTKTLHSMQEQDERVVN